MIHEHEALEIASASIDFDLSPELDRELSLALRECPVCAERASGYREQIRLMQRLPTLDASDATRRRVTAAALAGGVDRRSPMMLALAAALLLGLLLAVGAAAGALLQHKTSDPLTIVEPSASPATVVAVAAPSPSIKPSPTDDPGPVGGRFPDRIAPDSIVEVATTNLRVRSEPRVSSDSIRLEPFLQPSDRLFVVDGPVRADGYDWYRIAPVGTGTRAWYDLPSGWVARGDHDLTPWIAPAASHCPADPIEISELGAMHPLERISCFGHKALSLVAAIEGGPTDGWIAAAHFEDFTNVRWHDLQVRIVTAGPTTPSLPERAVSLIDGAFDRPDAGGCASGAGDDATALLACRSRFVVSRIATVPGQLVTDAAAVTVTDNLRVRSLPTVSDSSERLNLLADRTRLWVLDGPTVGSGYAWYHVAVPGVRTANGRSLTGWVASASRDGETWVETDAFDCPAPGDLTFADFAFLSTRPVLHGGLACFADGAPSSGQELSIEAHLRLDCTLDPVGLTGWRSAPERALILSDGDTEATALLASDTSALACGDEAGALVYRVSGHFDDSRALQCVAADVSGPASAAANQTAVYECRSRFVVMGFYVVGPGPTPLPSGP